MSSDAPTTATQPQPVRGTGRLIGGVILVVIGVLVFAVGGVLLGLHLGTRDDDGFYEIGQNLSLIHI